MKLFDFTRNEDRASRTNGRIDAVADAHLEHVAGGNGVWAGEDGNGTCTPTGGSKRR